MIGSWGRRSIVTPVPLSFCLWAAGSGPRMRCLLPRPLPSLTQPGKCHTAHSDPTSGHAAFRVGSPCSTAGTSVVPLVPQVQALGTWLVLPRPYRWLLRTIRLGYAIQFRRRPLKFIGIRFRIWLP